MKGGIDKAQEEGLAVGEGHQGEGLVQILQSLGAVGLDAGFPLFGQALKELIHHQVQGERGAVVDKAVGCGLKGADMDELGGDA